MCPPGHRRPCSFQEAAGLLRENKRGQEDETCIEGVECLEDAIGDEDVHAPPPSTRTAAASAGLLLVAFVAVVALAKSLTPTLEVELARLDVSQAVIGIVIAAVVLLPECLAALKAARANRLQTSLNLALGSALAAIGLTIPAVAAVSIAHGQPLELGLGEKDRLLLALLVGVITLGNRPDYGAPGDRAPGNLRGVPVLRRDPLGSTLANQAA
jgi:Ca2+/H+ antiporter